MREVHQTEILRKVKENRKIMLSVRYRECLPKHRRIRERIGHLENSSLAEH